MPSHRATSLIPASLITRPCQRDARAS